MGEGTAPTPARLTPTPRGTLGAADPVAFPFMAPRLQGLLSADGRLDLSLWGAGRLGSLRLQSLNRRPFDIAPNRLTWPGGGLWVAQSAPALLVRGAGAAAFRPARRAVAWDRGAHQAERTQRGDVWSWRLDWGHVRTRRVGDGLVIAGGATEAEADAAVALPAEVIAAEADGYAAACDRLPDADPLLRSLIVQGTHAALSSVRCDADGRFAGLAAGLAYSTPARTYFRDGYWTLQALLDLAPDIVRDQIDLLAEGVRDDGEAPSGVIVADDRQSAAWETLRAARRRIAATHQRPREWWSDHFDSPLFFVLTIDDYVRATGDREPAERHADLITAIFELYEAHAKAGGGLPAKGDHERDWADNVRREGFVAYDLGLWVGMLGAVERLTPALAARAAARRASAAALIEARLWLGDHYADWRRTDGSAETHLALDSLTLLRWDAVPAERALATLETVRSTLESRNAAQRWGDWGMLCAWPPFSRRSDLRAKSAFAGRYHNGADWPWLDGLYARERLRRGLAGWRYPLTRWWASCLAAGWAGPVEYFSPPFGRGSLLQGWSGYPAAVAMEFSAAMLAGDPEP